MHLYMYFDWIATQFKYTYCYVQCTSNTISLFSYSVSTKVGCQTALLKGWRSFVCCYIVLSMTTKH